MRECLFAPPRANDPVTSSTVERIVVIVPINQHSSRCNCNLSPAAWRHSGPDNLNATETVIARITGEDDLVAACLGGARLCGAQLSYRNLSFADLTGADLSLSNLFQSVLASASLPFTNLSYANCYGADFSGADLYCADLRGANMGSTDLRGADMDEAELVGTILVGAVYDATTRWPKDFDPISGGAVTNKNSGQAQRVA